MGNIMISLVLFILALGVFVVMLSPMASFTEIAQNSNNLNCKGYVDEDAVVGGQNVSYDSTKNTDTLGCLGIKLFMPFLILVFIAAGVTNLLTPGGSNFLSNLGGATTEFG